MARSKKYTKAQTRAYYTGQGYRAGMENKVIPFKNPENKKSFGAGFRSVKDKVAKYKKRGQN